MSRVHAEVYRQGPILAIRDSGSTNGTYLNGTLGDHSALSAGDVLRIGDWVGVLGPEPAPGHPPSVVELGQGMWGGTRLSECLAPVRRAALSSIPILVTGETGSGKERLAQSIHAWSGRTGPLVCINCPALPAPLAEGELFGYRRGAFTGADRANLGHLRAADGGTLLLDEIGDLPHPIQGKLLRVLEERVVVPLGETQPVPIDVRVVAAAQKPLEQSIHAGGFRGDLFARLAGVRVQIPPLRERREDVVPLFRHFLASHGGDSPPRFDACLAEVLCLHPWPFNVRELRLLAQNLLALHGHERELGVEHLPSELTRPPSEPAVPADQRFATRRERDLYRLAEALEHSRGNVKAAAAAIGCSRGRVYRLLGGRSVDELVTEHAAAAEDADGDQRKHGAR